MSFSPTIQLPEKEALAIEWKLLNLEKLKVDLVMTDSTCLTIGVA